MKKRDKVRITFSKGWWVDFFFSFFWNKTSKSGNWDDRLIFRSCKKRVLAWQIQQSVLQWFNNLGYSAFWMHCTVKPSLACGVKGQQTPHSLRSVLWIIHCLLVQGFMPRSRRPFQHCLLKLFLWCSLLIICWHAPAVVEKIKVTSLCGEGQAVSNEGPIVLPNWFLTHFMARMQSCWALPWGKAPGTSQRFLEPVVHQNL